MRDSELVLPGNINSYVNSPIYARTNGYLKKWYKDIGSHVQKGDLLAEIDTPEVDQQLAQARADLATAQANVKLAGITATRYQDLLKQRCRLQAGSGQLQRRLRRQTGHGAIGRKPTSKRLEDLESFKRVYAPFSGVITAAQRGYRHADQRRQRRHLHQGNVRSGADRSPARLRFRAATYAPSIRAGLKACLELTEFRAADFCGKVVRTADAIDPNTRTLLTEVDVPNPTGTLLQGAYAQVHFDAKLSGQRLSLPINALLFRPEGTMAAVARPRQHPVAAQTDDRPRPRQQRGSPGRHHHRRQHRRQSARLPGKGEKVELAPANAPGAAN